MEVLSRLKFYSLSRFQVARLLLYRRRLVFKLLRLIVLSFGNVCLNYEVSNSLKIMLKVLEYTDRLRSI